MVARRRACLRPALLLGTALIVDHAIGRCLGGFVFNAASARPLLQFGAEQRRGRPKASCSVEAAAATTSQGPSARARAEEQVEVEKELRLMTWIEVEARIERDFARSGSAVVIVPVGATEQHGPNGLIGTDHITAEAVARGLSDATGALLAPGINYGMSLHHGSFPGTVTLSPATFVGVVRDVSTSLLRSGFTHVLFINGHGGNVGPTYKAFADIAAALDLQERSADEEANGGDGGAESGAVDEEGSGAAGTEPPRPRGRLKLISWYAGRESSSLAKELYGGEVGQHATPDEVAMTQHLFPASTKAGVALDPAAIQVAKELGGMTKRTRDAETGLSVMDADDFRRRFPDGRMFSNPGLSTPEHGKRLLDAAVRDATEALEKFLSGQDIVEEEAAAAAKRAAAATAGSRKRRPRWAEDDESRQRGKGRWGLRGGKKRGAADQSKVAGEGAVAGVAGDTAVSAGGRAGPGGGEGQAAGGVVKGGRGQVETRGRRGVLPRRNRIVAPVQPGLPAPSG